MEGLKIVGCCIGAAILYGVLHDLVTANLCVEYFSVFHPDIFHTDSPWLLALGWGVIATWWMGLFIGGMIAVSAQIGSLPKIGWREILKPLGVVLGVSYVAAIIAWFIGFLVVKAVPEFVYRVVPRVAAAHLGPDRQKLFTGDLYAHNASFFVSGIGGFVLCAYLIRKRMARFRELQMSGLDLAP